MELARPALWNRFVIELVRVLVTNAELERRARLVRITDAKVAEFQGRGLVHFHAIIRLGDPEDRAGARSTSPPTSCATPSVRR